VGVGGIWLHFGKKNNHGNFFEFRVKKEKTVRWQRIVFSRKTKVGKTLTSI